MCKIIFSTRYYDQIIEALQVAGISFKDYKMNIDKTVLKVEKLPTKIKSILNTDWESLDE